MKKTKQSVMVRALTKLWGEPRFQVILWLSFSLLLAVVFWLWWSGVDLAKLQQWLEVAIERGRESPLWLFAALVILPAFPVPASPFMILAGVVFTPKFGLVGAILLTLLAMGINMSWTYWVAANPARGLVNKLLCFLEVELPELSRSNAVKLTLLLRVTPGIPFFLHNLILGFVRVPFRIFLPISLATTSLFTVGFVVFGESITSGRGKVAMLAISLILTAAVVTSIVRGRFTSKSKALDLHSSLEGSGQEPPTQS